MHGGLSPQLKNLDQLRQIQRPVDPPNPSMLVDLLWHENLIVQLDFYHFLGQIPIHGPRAGNLIRVVYLMSLAPMLCMRPAKS